MNLNPMKKNNNDINNWITEAFGKAEREAGEMEKIADRISEVLDKRTEDILNAWAETSNTAIVFALVTQASNNDDFGETLYNLVKMGVISGYISAYEDIARGKLKIRK